MSKDSIFPTYPFRVEIEVINACNCNCDYCYAAPFNGYVPPLKDIKVMLDKTEAQVKPFSVVILGGEPFLRIDMIDLLEYAVLLFSNGVVSISSNGTVFPGMGEEKLTHLKEISSGTPLIQVSIDSITNRELQKSARSFQGIIALQKHDIPFRVGMVLTKNNFGDYLQTVDKLLDFPALRSINLEPLQKINDQHYGANAISQQQLLEVKYKTMELVVKKSRTDIRIVGITDVVDTLLFERLRGRKNIGIELKDTEMSIAGVYADGNVSTGGALGRTNIVGNLLRQEWKTIWNAAAKDYKNRHMGLMIIRENNRSKC